VHWGYFSKELSPKLTIESGSTVVVEMASHHACDDYDLMIKGDGGMEEIFEWSTSVKGVSRRGAKGSGDGVHVLTGPIAVEGAMPGDILKVEIVDLKPRPNAQGKTYGSNAAAWWGYQARASKVDGTPFTAGGFTGTPGQNDEVITIYELFTDGDKSYATPYYQFYWPTITDPDGVERDYIQYPGTCVAHDYKGFSSTVSDMNWTKNSPITYMDSPYKAKIPINMHVGCMGLAPASHSSVDSIPPMPSGGNLDDKRIGKGTTMYYPVEVAGGLLSMGDAHMAQGDSEMDGTGIETSITGTFKITLIKKAAFKPWMGKLDFPLGETATSWIVHSFTEKDYLETYKDNPGEIYGASSIDKAMMNTYLTTRTFVMAAYGLSEAEANTIITQAVDFGMTQLVDGNWGVHGIIPKGVFKPEAVRRALSRSTPSRREMQDVDIPLSADNVHWGYFSKELSPKLTIESGSTVVVEMASHHACDDYDLMIKGDGGMEEIFEWSTSVKGVSRRGAKGSGDGVHVLTGPIAVEGAMPGDILKVEIVDLKPRPNAQGKTYGSNAAAWWGYQARASKVDGTPFTAGGFTGTPGQNDEVITIYELFTDGDKSYATPYYQFYWPTITDPDGVERDYIQYPGTCVAHDYKGFSSTVSDMNWTKNSPITYMDSPYKAKIPINMHVGCMGLAPASHSSVDSIPPMPSGGNLDDKRIGKGTTMYYPVEVAGGLLSMGDAHMAQGDSEMDGTGIETSITGTFKITLIKKAAFKPWMGKLDFPLGETATSWIVHSFTEKDYLETYKDNPGEIYGASSIDKAMMNTYLTTRTFVMAAYGLSEAEANTIITQAVDFGMTQLVDGNWGVHGIIPKAVFLE